MKAPITKVTKDMSARQFLKVIRENPLCIKSSTIVPPKLGSNSFGKIHVEFK